MSDSCEICYDEIRIPLSGSSSHPVRYPDVDIYETPDSIIVVVDMPGVSPENLDIDIKNELLIVKGKVTPSTYGVRIMVQEYSPGDYYRELSLGDGLDYTRIKAQLRNGELTLQIPKKRSFRLHKVKVKTWSG